MASGEGLSEEAAGKMREVSQGKDVPGRGDRGCVTALVSSSRDDPHLSEENTATRDMGPELPVS